MLYYFKCLVLKKTKNKQTNKKKTNYAAHKKTGNYGPYTGRIKWKQAIETEELFTRQKL